MIRGKITIVLGFVALACVALVGCGNSDSPSSTKTADAGSSSANAAAGATSSKGASNSKGFANSNGASGATGPTLSPSQKRQIAKQKRQNAARVRRSERNLKNPQHDANAGDGPANPEPAQAPQLSTSEKQQITDAIDKYFQNLGEHNIGYVCSHSYTSAYLSSLGGDGGCQKSTEKLIGSTTEFTPTIYSMGTDKGSGVAHIYLSLVMKSSGGSQQVSTDLYYANEGGVWKRTLPPS